MVHSWNRARRAVGTVPQISGIGVPVDGAIIGDLEGRIAVLVEIFPLPGANGFGVARSIGMGNARSKEQNQRDGPGGLRNGCHDVAHCRLSARYSTASSSDASSQNYSPTRFGAWPRLLILGVVAAST